MIYTFFDFELDEELYELRARGEVVDTQARVFALIHYLLANRERVVSKEELVQTVWKGTVVSDTAISQVVMLARRALRDDCDRPRVLKTLRGRGFRFVAEVQLGRASLEASSLASAPPIAAAGGAELAKLSVCESNLVERLPRVVLSAPSSTGFLGRSGELARLLRGLELAEHGVGGLWLISGDAGVGKTALAGEFARSAAQRGVQVIWGRAWEDAGAPAFWPWIQVLRALLERESLEPMRESLVAQLGALASWRTELAAPATAESAAIGDPAERFRRFDAIARLLRERDPLGPAWTLILEDLHAFDAASLELLRFLQPELPALRLMLVATYRDLAARPGTELAAFVDACSGSSQQLALSGLSAQDAELMCERLGQGHLARELFELSDGHPLLLRALAERTAQHGGVPLQELAGFALPERIRRVVREQLQQLPAATRGVLAVASGLGREFAVPRLAALIGSGEVQLLEWLEPAQRCGLIRPAALGSPQRRFSHAQVCHAVYSELGPGERIGLHRAIAELLESSFAPALRPLDELAHHYQRAAAGGCRDKAIEYSLLAAERAEELGRFECAAGLYERTFELALPEACEVAQRHDWLCRAGFAWYRAGELDRARSAFERAAELARHAQDAERFAWAVLFCSAALRCMLLHDQAQQQLLRQALAQLPERDGHARAVLLSASMVGARATQPKAERWRVTRAAVAMARRLQDERALQWALNAQHLAMWGAGAPDEMAPIAEEMIELGRRTGDQELVLDAMLWRMADCSSGASEDVVRRLAEYAREAEAVGSPWHRYMALGAHTNLAALVGDFARAAELSDQMLALGLRVREPFAEGFHQVRALFQRFHRGPWPNEAAPVPDAVPADYQVFWVLAAAMAGDRARATPLLRRLEDDAFHRELLDALRRPTLAVLGQVAVMFDEPAAIERAYRAFLPDPGVHLHLLAWEYLGPGSYYLGLMAAALGLRDEAIGHFERALEETVYALAFRAYTQFEYGKLRIELGDVALGRQLLAEAADSAQRFGMEPLRAKVLRSLT